MPGSSKQNNFFLNQFCVNLVLSSWFPHSRCNHLFLSTIQKEALHFPDGPEKSIKSGDSLKFNFKLKIVKKK